MNERELDEYITIVAGGPPDDFAELIKLGEQIHHIAMETCGVPELIEDADVERQLARLRDATLLASFAYTWKKDGRPNDQHPAAWIQRAKQMAQWCMRPFAAPTPLAILENKAREIGRLVAERTFTSEGFVLVMTNVELPDRRSDQHMTYLSTADRTTTIALLEELVEKMKHEQRGLS